MPTSKEIADVGAHTAWGDNKLNSKKVESVRYFLTPDKKIGTLAGIKKTLTGERYEILFPGEERKKLFYPDMLVQIPEEKLSWFKTIYR